MTKNDVTRVLDTVLSSPGMSEPVRMDLKISRKNVLLLSHVIEQGLMVQKEGTSLIGSLSEGDLSELRNIARECLQKGGLIELNDKLMLLSENSKS